MAEETSSFPWPPYYGHFNFFEARMRGHSRITGIKNEGGGIYDLALASGDSMRVFLCECYSFGVAEYIETIEKLGRLGSIVINSAWCGYTLQAKHTARSEKIGLYKIGDFMAALNKSNAWDYLNDGEKDAFQKNGWL
jgi:hypothetical protein